MLRPCSRADFRRNPRCAFLGGESWFYFAFDGTLLGYVIWVWPAPEDVRALVRLLELELDRPPHNGLVDLGGLELVAPEVFEALASYTVK